MLPVQTCDSTAVRNHVTFEPVFLSKQVDQKVRTASDRNPIVGVVGTHGPLRMCFGEHFLERMHQNFVHVPERNLWIGTTSSVTSTIRMAVGSEVFGRRYDALGLQAFDLLNAQLAHQIR